MTGVGRLTQCRTMLVMALLAVLIGVAIPAPVGADDLALDDPDAARELAERYAPIVMLKAQEAECDADGEPYAPSRADIVLDNPDVLLRQVGSGNPVVMAAPSAADLAGRGEGFFLDFPGGSLEPECIYERDFLRYADDEPVTVYAHIVQEEDHPDQLALQYWFYWYYNDWNNKHESDWEGIQLLFDASSIDEALQTEPVSVGFAQHEGGERASWDSAKLEREGTRPVVYPSAGSHASYFSSAVYMGRSASEGFGCDDTSGPSERFAAEVVVLPDAVTDPEDPLAWLAFEGRWGERQSGANNGPTGPMDKERWTEPVTWHDELRSSSVIIPSGDSIGDQVIGAFCATVEWGAGQLILLSTSPARLIVTLVLAGLLVRWLIRRTVWTRAADSPLVMRRRAGQVIRGAYATYRGAWRSLVRFGVVYLPAIVLAGLIAALVRLLPLIRDVLDVAGDRSGVGLVFAIIAGSIPSVIAGFVVNAMVADHLNRDDPDAHASAAIRRVWELRGPIAATIARAFGIVAVLAMTIVGLPWAIRQTVRYQFSAQVVVIEGSSGAEALRRSSDLVRGRWFHTALMITVFNALPFVTAVVIGLVLLLAVAGLPLWLFSAVMTLVYAVLVPLSASAQTLLYGDAVAEFDESDAVDSELETATV